MRGGCLFYLSLRWSCMVFHPYRAIKYMDSSRRGPPSLFCLANKSSVIPCLLSPSKSFLVSRIPAFVLVTRIRQVDCVSQLSSESNIISYTTHLQMQPVLRSFHGTWFFVAFLTSLLPDFDTCGAQKIRVRGTTLD